MAIKHQHHIIPKHMGGTNEDTNIIDLSVEEHALAHKVLWEKYGKWQDEVAWKALSGQITSAEINYIILVKNNSGEKNPMFGKVSYMRGKKHTAEARRKIKEARKKQKIVHSEETKRKIGAKHKNKTISDEHKKRISESNRVRKLPPRSEESRRKISEKIKNLEKKECPHCGKICNPGNAKMWHFDNCKRKNI